MIYTTKQLMDLSPGCITSEGLILWLRDSKVPYIQKRNGDVVVLENDSFMLSIAKDNITPLLDTKRSFRRDEPGVYLLKDRGEVVYVGMTKSLFNRMEKHLRGDMKFDEIAFISASERDAPLLEAELIARHMPKHNKAKTSFRKPENRTGKSLIANGPDIPVFAELKSL